MLILDYPLLSDLSMAGPLMFFLFLFLDKEINLEVQYVSITDQGTCGNKIKPDFLGLFLENLRLAG